MASDKTVLLALAQTLTNKTLTAPVLTSPVLNTGLSGTAFLDENDMASDSATKAASQQSIKAYVDSGTVTMTNKTLTSPVVNTGISGTAITDEDDMSSDSATKVPTQQSVKAYVDSGTVTMTNKTLTAPVMTSFSDGSNTITVPTNGMSACKLMVGDSNTIAWFYLNTAPPGWKVLTTGADTVIGVAATSYTSSGTTDGTTADKLVDSGADFVTDAVAVNDIVFNTTDKTTAYVTAIDDLNTLSISSDIFVSGEGYRVGGLCADGGYAAGSWQQPEHTLTIAEMPAHTHTVWPATALGGGSGSAVYVSPGASTTGSTGGDGDHNHGLSYRPSASVGKLFQLDTA